MSAKKPTKAELLRAMNAIHARLEAVTYKGVGPGNVWETIGGITYLVESTLGKQVVKSEALPKVVA